MAIEDHFNLSFTLKRPTFAKDAGGSSTRTLATITTFAGRLVQMKADAKTEYGKKATDEIYNLYTNQTIRNDDLIVYNSQTYSVLHQDNPHELDKFYKIVIELKV